jgi:histidyl-tRNA synthetase
VILELKRQGIVPPSPERPRAFVVYMGKEPALKEAAVRLVAELRHAGIKTEMSYGDRSPKAQMKQANASGAAFALIVGEEELAQGSIAVRSLRAEDAEGGARQVVIPRSDVLRYLQG